MLRDEALEHRQQELCKRFRRHAKCNRAFRFADGPLYLLRSAVAIANDRTGADKKILARPGHANALVRTVQQGHTKFPFEALDGLRQRTLRNVECARGGAEAALLDH
jgi:hypothetical protein